LLSQTPAAAAAAAAAAARIFTHCGAASANKYNITETAAGKV